MGRRRQGPWLRKQDNCYYTTINRRNIKLGHASEPWEDIERRYADELGRVEKPTHWLMATLIERFLEHSKEKNSPDTYSWYQSTLDDYKSTLASKQLALKVNPDDVTRWVQLRYRGCAASTKANAYRCVIRCLNWAVKTRKIPYNPIAGIERPTPGTREVTIDFDQFIEILTHVKDREFKDVLYFLWYTGCRPQEFRIIEAKHISGKVITLTKKESKGKKYKRKMWLSDKALPIVERLARKYPEGPIFRNTRGKPWKRNQLASRFWRLREKTSIEGLCAYVLRHSFATRMLKSGVDSVKLGVLMGHRDPSMVAKVYQHLMQDDAYMTTVAAVAPV